MTYTAEQAYEFILVALCVWREARGEPRDAKRGVAWTIRNRAMQPSWWGKDWVSVVLKPWQFSSFNADDPNVAKWPSPQDSAWLACMEAAEEALSGSGEDPTGGATHYHDASLDRNPPSWACDGSMQPTAHLGRLRFYRRVRT
jgi:spore germination cell wall hydrolase CwlJ-like protein